MLQQVHIKKTWWAPSKWDKLLIQSELTGLGKRCPALQHQRGQFEVAAQQDEEATRQQLHHAVQHANASANLEMTQRAQTLESNSEADFSTRQRELLSLVSTEATQVLEDQQQISVLEAMTEIKRRKGNLK